MKRIGIIIITIFCFSSVYGQHLDIANPALLNIVDENSQVIKLHDGFQFTEGPVWNEEGQYLLFSDIPANTIFKLEPTGEIVSYRKPSQNSNGLTFDKEGNLIIAEHSGRKISKISPEGNYSTIVDNYMGTKLNSPNDVIVDSQGAIYFTDPPYGRPKDASDTLSFNGVYKYSKGEIHLISDDLYRPNGIALSPDERSLYVANSGQPKQFVKYAISKSGKIGKGKVFFDASGLSGEGNPDGIKVDPEGNIFATGPGGVLVLTENGELLGTIKFPETPANLAFGGHDMKTLFVTARTGLYSIRLK
ncbi:SMP-30/gluconolactonase/LRE family protein [Cyclobacterium marinum]|uniref:SMP-30/Gluconolaconase/LRE-like region-containing protein n=1 Tax=Cyclobacterium marinum (strain ATCC 25205 / DSM 745 / LMG 13164 / NCIMB 1802) TaxID=880070 RepID=G0J6E6_CYCMS|nr:SMP-30/gluconolactonase/LRE family protein [Cyclobacterium marinum]AEL27641.1 SMP-30/Gluconolaconase/LRE-like region-containing protein [Cyclobacterium marinum DSM 745]MBI0397413.1 SMP-30/gluconolactonase/LRE family protein [Cyclobacterium marinum]